MKIVLITGSAGLVGSESVKFFCERGFRAVGLDNNMCQTFFGKEASTEWNRNSLLKNYPDHYIHYDVDIRDHGTVKDGIRYVR
jgi:CDP-paratose 2-epimerase